MNAQPSVYCFLLFSSDLELVMETDVCDMWAVGNCILIRKNVPRGKWIVFVCVRKRTLWTSRRRRPPRRNRPGRSITNSNCSPGRWSTFYTTDSPCWLSWTGDPNWQNSSLQSTSQRTNVYNVNKCHVVSVWRAVERWFHPWMSASHRFFFFAHECAVRSNWMTGMPLCVCACCFCVETKTCWRISSQSSWPFWFPSWGLCSSTTVASKTSGSSSSAWSSPAVSIPYWRWERYKISDV